MPEMVVALALLFFLAGLLAQLMASARKASWRVSRRLEAVETRRVTRDLVDWAVRSGGGRSDPGRAMRVRFFVGHGEPCPTGGFSYRGRRLPDAGRDSLWLLGDDGRWRVEAATGLALQPCADSVGGGSSLGFRLGTGGGTDLAVVVVRVFESGAFTLSDALRYARSGTRSQPLTGAVLDPGHSAVEVRSGRVHLSAVAEGDSVGVERSWAVR